MIRILSQTLQPRIAMAVYKDYGSSNEQAMKAEQKKAWLLARATQAQRRAEDAKQNMLRLKFEIEDLQTLAKKTPSTLNIEELSQAAQIYGKLVEDYISANYTMHYANQAAEGADIFTASREAAVQIFPSLSEVKKDLQTVIQAHDKDAAQAASANAPSWDKEFAAHADLLASVARVEILYDLAKLPTSTAEDGQNLLHAVEQLKADRKRAYQEFRDTRLAELQAGGTTEIQARHQIAQELRQQRREQDQEGTRKSRIQKEKTAKRLAGGLVRGDVQSGREAMPRSIRQHHDGKQMKKSAKVERESARRKFDMPGLRQSVDRYVQASVRMTLGILNELTYQLMAEGYSRAEARKMAMEEFRHEHERRKNGHDTTAQEWKQSWINYRSDARLVRAVFKNPQSIPQALSPQPKSHPHPASDRGENNNVSGRHRSAFGTREVAQVKAAMIHRAR